MGRPHDVLGQIEREHEKRRRREIRILSAAAYTPKGRLARLLDRWRRR